MKIITTNKKAYHNYSIEDTVEAGLVLSGCEVKSIRLNSITIRESYAKIINGEAWLINCLIPAYEQGNRFNLKTDRDRKLLLHRREIEKLSEKMDQKGYVLVPLKLYFKDGRVKLEIGLGKPKKLYDKREVSKNRSIKRELDRATKTNR